MLKRLFIALLVLVLIGAAGAVGGYFYWQSRLEAPLALDEPMLYQVPSGAGFNQVVAQLDSQGVVEDAWAFQLLAKVEPDRVPRLRTGEY
ncbi:MAG: endolytic transglycosylase MltG, partial [Halomonas sp.]